MQTLKLHNHRMEEVKAGTKHHTIRNGVRDIKLGPLKLEATAGGIPDIEVNVNRIVICRAGDVELSEISDYSSLDEFINTMKGIYPDLTTESVVTIIHFSK